MSHIESVNIKKQRKRLQNQKYYQKKRQKTEQTCAEQSLSDIINQNDVQYDQNVEHIPEIFNYNLRICQNNMSIDSYNSNETINFDNDN
jgi:hypothetical protein